MKFITTRAIKFQIFIWSACNEWLPTMGSLVRLHVPVVEWCPVCSREKESVMHALWSCSVLKMVRARFGLLKGCATASFASFKDFCSSCVDRLDEFELCLLCVVLWRLWFIRNQAVHERVRHDVTSVVSWLGCFFSDFREANKTGDPLYSTPKLVVPRWRPPDRGIYKLNTDAAVDEENSCVGLGMIIRDHLGRVMASSSQKVAMLVPRVWLRQLLSCKG
ncbi:hypothetical protein Dsin_003439 [Dipteronia sinensis]|uniref:Reverse transcriptase zinc-binding domain-containing protein n=1 Tax=Dipteronia sinensis TaxID=43782 RepID=A0AAE0B8Y1_9ROSI|nr:hypothetical protein Dsin_003439 [Dipteronia sinensis]